MVRQQTTVFYGENPSQMYFDALVELLVNGKELAPRGKKIKELRPVIFEYHNPLSRVTFLKNRVINPFFQLAEAFWIMTGRSDVKWLTDYNKSIAQFSDDGVFFNAPYGERLRSWGKNDARGYVYNPIDQLTDCYEKLKADPDTRQAVAFIGDPRFDNSAYTLAGGKDIACNINIKFKIRDGKLDITVDNRSNDLHWGTFGANLCQFATIQEMMASWLGIPVGTYFQETDSLHIYLDEYGAKETEKILVGYGTDVDIIGMAFGDTIEVKEFLFEDEPRFSANKEEFENACAYYYDTIDPLIRNKEYLNQGWSAILESFDNCPDEYLRLTFQAMFVKQAHNHGYEHLVIEGMKRMKDCSWKVSCLRFLSKRYKENDDFKSLYSHLEEDIIDYIERKEM